MSHHRIVLTADLGPGVTALFTTRAGGVSQGRWAGLNLALHVGDDAGHVRRNRRDLSQQVGVPVRFVDQVHGREVHVVDRAVPEPEAPPVADAVVSVGAGQGVAVLVADCVPLLLVDPAAGIVAAAHAGRRGLLGGVVQAVLASMVTAGAVPHRVRAAIGPCIGACCYEVPEAMRDDASRIIAAAHAVTTWGTPAIDLRAGCRALLHAGGVVEVSDVGGCTVDDPAFYSYRRDGVTGRFAGVVGLTRSERMDS